MQSISFFRLIILSLQWVGTWPYVTRSPLLYLLNLIYRLFCFLMVSQYFLGFFANSLLSDNMTEITQLISLTLACFNVLVKATPLVLFRGDYLKLVNKVDHFIKNEMKDSEKNYQLICKRSKTYNKLTKIYILSLVLNSLTLCIIPVMDTPSSRMVNNITILFRKLSLPAKYPFDTESTPMFEFTFLLQIIQTIINAVGVTVSDLFYCALVYFNSIQYECLANNLKDIPPDENANRNLSKYARKHREIIQFSIEVKKILAPITSLECCIIVMQSSFIIFTAVLDPTGTNIIKQLVFYVVEIARLYLYGWFSSELIDKSQIGFALYESMWYNSPKNFKISLLIMMIKLQKPVVIMAVKIIVISLELCNDLTRASYSVYTVMSGMD